tara:strand:- start:76 stop:345 length:270 start_codon:yes stop_codon:yes gene_type:complete
MDKLSELMIITMEECGELTQACSKVLRKRENQQITREPSKQSLVDLTKEVADVMCMIDLMKEQGLVNDFDLMQGVKSKRDKLKIWSKLI